MKIYIVMKNSDGLGDYVHKAFYLEEEAEHYVNSIERFYDGVGYVNIKWPGIKDRRCVSKFAIEYECRKTDEHYDFGDYYFIEGIELV